MEKHEMEKKEAAPADAKDADAGHDDAAQDKELIKKMLKKHLGEEPSEEVMKHAQEAYEALVKGGASHEEACETASHAMKAAKAMHMLKKEAMEDEAKKEGEAKEDEAKHEAAFDDKGLNSKGDDANETPKAAFGDKGLNESAEVLKLKGEVASLRESLKKRELADYIDSKLAATKLARSNTKVIRENLATARSEAEVDQKIALFLEGYKLGAEGDELSWIVGAEKTTSVEKQGDSFADCVQ